MFLLNRTSRGVLLTRFQLRVPTRIRCFSFIHPEEAGELPKASFMSNAAVESGQMVAQYPLVPVTEHPIFPGSSAVLSLSKQ